MYRAWKLQDQLILDESQLVAQVDLFCQGKLQLFRWPGMTYPAAAMLPGFQAVLAALAFLGNDCSPGTLRIYCFAFSIAYVLIVYAVLRQLTTPQNAVIRAAQTYLVPVVFPFNCLMYTDVFSLLVNTGALWACLQRRYVVAGAIMLLSLFVRQTNVVFILFLCGFSYLEIHGTQVTRDLVIGHLRRCWLWLVGISLFALFVLFQERVGLDDPANHPFTISAGNLLCSVVLVGIMFWPIFLAHCLVVLRWARQHSTILLAIVAASAAVAFAYSPTHIWNNNDWQLRNQLLDQLLGSNPRRLVLALILAATSLAIVARGFSRPSAWMVYVFWFLSLAPISLVEPRYQFGALLLYQVFRKSERPAAELGLWAWFAALSIALEVVTTSTRYIL
jgi:alpha-1,2-glucosyltransferase